VHLQGADVYLVCWTQGPAVLTVKIKTLRPFERSLTTYQPTRCYISEEWNLREKNVTVY
jgi:hypothetical protein